MSTYIQTDNNCIISRTSKFGIWSILILLAILTVSCEKEPSNFEEIRNNILGEWNLKHSVQDIRFDTVYAEFASNYQIEFYENGTGTRTTDFGQNLNFDWYYQFDPETFIIIYKASDVFFQNSQAYNVILNTPEEQIWTYTIIDPISVADEFRNTWAMSRQ